MTDPLPSRWARPDPKCPHPRGRLIHERDLGGCPEEGMALEGDQAVLCRACGGWIAAGTPGILALLFRLVVEDASADR